MKRLLWLTPLLLLLWRPVRTRAEGCIVAVHHHFSEAAKARWKQESIREPGKFAREQRHLLIRRALSYEECIAFYGNSIALMGAVAEEPLQWTLPLFPPIAEIGDVYWAQAVPRAVGEDTKGGRDGGWTGVPYGGVVGGIGGVVFGGGSPGQPAGPPVSGGGAPVAPVVSEVPEPTTLILLSTGMFAVVAMRRWR